MKIGYLGIDVSKGYSDFVLLDKNKKELEPCFQLDDNNAGHTHLFSLLKKMMAKHDLAGIEAIMESTGGYENNWLSLLKKRGGVINLKAARINPFGIKHDSLAGMERTITDSTSARRIAMYALNHPEKIQYEQPACTTMNSLRSMYNFISTKIKQKVQLSNQLEKLLYSAFPELLVYMREQMPKWVLLFLEEYPTASAAKEAQPEDFLTIPKIRAAKAEELYKKAKRSIASVDNRVVRSIIREYAKDLNVLMEQIAELKKSLEKESNLPAEIKLLSSFPGIGTYSAIGLMIEIEDINRFSSSKKMCSFFGLHPKFKQSGDMTSGVQMSKQGSPEVRAVLFMVAKSALVFNPHIRAIYDRFRSQGMAYHQAMGVVMHKILRIVYGMLKSGNEYCPMYDQQRQQESAKYRKGKDQKAILSCNNKRRFMTKSEEAPISKRQDRKRKEQPSSSNLEKETNTRYDQDCP